MRGSLLECLAFFNVSFKASVILALLLISRPEVIPGFD
jgi:hypothetical protein